MTPHDAIITNPVRSRLSDDPDMLPLISSFVDALPTRIDRMSTLLSQGAHNELGRVAHQLKGACGGYGFIEIGAMAGMLERAVNDGADIETLRAQVDELAALCARVRA